MKLLRIWLAQMQQWKTTLAGLISLLVIAWLLYHDKLTPEVAAIAIPIALGLLAAKDASPKQKSKPDSSQE